LLAVTGRRPPLGGLPPGATLYVNVERLAPEAALVLEAVLDDGAVWVLAAVEPGAAPPAALAVRLAPVVLTVTPLGQRPADVPELARILLDGLVQRRGGGRVTLAPDAVQRLGAHGWPGDVAELEAVLARALLVTDGDVVEAEHLALGPEPAEAPAPAAAAAARGAEIEFLLAELAHELRNPMVTIKTFARHLPELLEDAELRSRFEKLTNEAIDRMDGLLDNVITFARFGPPQRDAVEVGPLIERAIADVNAELEGRAIHVRSTAPTSTRFAADPEQLSYALRNLLTGVVREVPPEHEVQLDASANGVVTLRFAGAGEAAERLRRLAGGEDEITLADPTLLPLSFRLARAVLERNGGTLSIVPEVPDATTVVIRLPTHNEAAAE
jgi:signal transduction histidine kinase